MARLVPAWTVQTGSYSLEDYVFILTEKIGSDGWPNTRLVHRLTPVDPAEQARLKKVMPEWAKTSAAKREEEEWIEKNNRTPKG